MISPVCLFKYDGPPQPEWPESNRKYEINVT